MNQRRMQSTTASRDMHAVNVDKIFHVPDCQQPCHEDTETLAKMLEGYARLTNME